MERLPPLFVDWTMKPISSAITEINDLPNGRLELKIKHDIIKGVSPEMLVWWFHHFTEMKHYNYKGQDIHLYRLWHPIDHIDVKILKKSSEGEGFRKGATVQICEAIGENVEKISAAIKRMDITGLTLHLRKGGLIVGRLTHNFTATKNGTLYESQLLIGPTTPIVGKLFTKLIRKKFFTIESSKAWLKHNIEEVGNFQYFLPDLYNSEK